MRLGFALVLMASRVSMAAPEIDRPRVLDPRLDLVLFCREPDIVTPVALDVDDRGRVWVIESNTHFPKADYRGHRFDRLLTIEDRNGDGRADRFTVFADDLHHAMGLAWRGPGRVFLATRRAVWLLEDEDDDGCSDQRSRLAHLETAGDYPHNGLSGFAFDELDNVYFGMGENLGASYALVGADGSRLEGGGEGGNIFRMRPDGSCLERWATGFWNPFDVAFDAFGRLFAVDNDPDSRPPCRLLHIVRGGDYGYRFWLGRKGLHPFSSWNGGLPGTLPMVAGTGEAPSGVVFCENAEFPPEYRGAAFVTSWGDNRLEVFHLEPEGASFRARRRSVVEGDQNFRPVGIAFAPDGDIYYSDWVDRDYSVHGKGRVWRLRPRPPADTSSGGGTTSGRRRRAAPLPRARGSRPPRRTDSLRPGAAPGKRGPGRAAGGLPAPPGAAGRRSDGARGRSRAASPCRRRGAEAAGGGLEDARGAR